METKLEQIAATAVKQRPKSVVREIRTPRSVGTGGGRPPPVTRWAPSNGCPYRNRAMQGRPRAITAGFGCKPPSLDHLRLASGDITQGGPKRNLRTEALSRAEPEVRIHFPPAQSQERTTERPKSSGDAGRAAWAQPDPPERAMRRCWLTFAAAALVTGAYAAQVAVPAAESRQRRSPVVHQATARKRSA